MGVRNARVGGKGSRGWGWGQGLLGPRQGQQRQGHTDLDLLAYENGK